MMIFPVHQATPVGLAERHTEVQAVKHIPIITRGALDLQTPVSLSQADVWGISQVPGSAGSSKVPLAKRNVPCGRHQAGSSSVLLCSIPPICLSASWLSRWAFAANAHGSISCPKPNLAQSIAYICIAACNATSWKRASHAGLCCCRSRCGQH